MAKFSLEKFPAGFFDVTQDIGRALPVDLIERWTKGAQSPDSARRLLEPSRREGIVVSSDSAGLTRLTERKGLLEILALIDRPKQLIHAFGAAAGGEAVGIWAADNTEMFYSVDVGADGLVSMLLTVQDQIRRECEVQVGLAAHYGQYFSLGGGLYGPDADRVETVAENYTEGGEVVVTAELAGRLARQSAFSVLSRTDLPSELGANLRVTGGPRRDDLSPGVARYDARYPIPYSEDFYADLLRYASSGEDPELLEEVHRTYSRRRAVVLIERERDEESASEVAVLNELALSLAMKKTGLDLLAGFGGSEIKTSGSIGIYTFEECQAALGFAKRFREIFLGQGIASRIGIDYGEVLVFQVLDGIEDIAGAPVNIASKIAQDEGIFGRIYLSDEAARNARLGSEFRAVSFEVSGVRIGAWMD
jgi:class 3 adenylate cyclase